MEDWKQHTSQRKRQPYTDKTIPLESTPQDSPSRQTRAVRDRSERRTLPDHKRRALRERAERRAMATQSESSSQTDRSEPRSLGTQPTRTPMNAKSHRHINVDRSEWHAQRKRDMKQQQKKQEQESSFSWRVLFKRLWLGIRLAVLALVIVVIVGVYLFYKQVNEVADAIVVPDVRSNPSLSTPLAGMNVLIVGVDERPDHPEEGVRSDTLILARIDAAGKWVNLLSIPRDTQIDLRDIGITKINVAYGQGYARAVELYGQDTSPQQGGMALAAETVERFIGMSGKSIRVDYTAQINFDGFVHIIDALGGVTIDVPKHIIDDAYPTEDYGYMRVEFQPGVQEMDGETALIYARTRHADSDFSRSQRQQQVMRAIVNKMQAKGWMDRVATVPDILEGIKGSEESAPPIITTLPFDRLDILFGMIVLAGGLESDSIGQIRITPETVDVIEQGSNLLWDMQGVGEQINLLYRKPASDEETVMTETE